ncbi:transcription initiation factor TFIID subunit 4B isoform X2 [Rousettus aegyptiacus]|uniref:TATA-box binding protein associated factor 4b n=1 Tax=Rousettus aegyptiacus TaxID=9407 RepID=A0A7J8DLX0_ROUAE|nr:transcription initiation factor TFIID subunit 4B isoform X2 [Rousettus aegyptiacus]KAF6423989.1 TATA-box binding protein associated factor 4b [Rousettus aegyptiacus]
MPAGLTEPAGAASPAGVSASGTLTMAPAGALPLRVESTPVPLGAVTKAPVSVCMEPTVSQPLRSSVGTLVTKVAPVSALPKLSSGPVLPAPQIVAVKAPNTTIQLPANLQLPPGTVLIKSNSGQLMLVSPQQAVTRAETTSNITSRPAVQANAQTVKFCTMPNSNSQLIKKVAVAPVKKLTQIGTTVVTTVPKPSSVQSVPTSVVTVTPVKPLNTVTTLKPSSLGVSPTPSNEPSLKAENSTAAQTNLSPTMLENVKKCKNFLAMLIKLACSGSQSPEMGQNVKKLVEQLLDAKIEAEEFTRQLYVELKSSPQPHLVPFLKKSVSALRQLMPNSQSFIQQCLQQTSNEVVIATCTTPVTTSSVMTTVSSIQSEKSIIVSGATTPRTVSVPTLNPLADPGGAKTGVVTLHSVGPAAVPGGTTAGTVLLQTPKPLVTSVQNTVTAVSLQPEKPVVSGAAVTLALPSVTFGETSAAAICFPPVKPVVTSAGTSDKPVIGAPVQIKLAQPGSILSQPAGIPQAVKVKQLFSLFQVVQQPPGGISKQLTALSHSSALTIQKSGQKMPVSNALPTSQFTPASILKQIILPGNKILSLQGSSIQKNKIKENGTTSFRDEDDINDVTSMAGVSLNEENACILATNSELVGTLIQSCKDEPFLFIGALQKRILDIGKKHDITELNSDAVNLISHATQERLRGLLEKLTAIAQHRMTTYKTSENYILSSDTRSQLKFLEKLDQLEKQRKDLEEREMLLKAAKSRSNKEDPEQLRLKQKAKELQQLELAQIQHRDANLTALAAIGPRKKRPLESGSGNEGLKDNLHASGTSSLTATKPLLRPRITRICLRDLIFCMEQEREMKYSRALYLALLK